MKACISILLELGNRKVVSLLLELGVLAGTLEALLVVMKSGTGLQVGLIAELEGINSALAIIM